MIITADDIIRRISNGVAAALETNQLFLGIEQGDSENADIHPEYVTTVKVAENLTDADCIVSLETHMKTLRKQALGIGRLLSPSVPWPTLKAKLATYTFGPKDSERLDILVRSSESTQPPLLMIEAKLGIRNVKGILADINRIVRLLQMYNEVSALDRHHIYGAVVFHLMEEKKTPDSVNPSSAVATLTARSAKLLTQIDTHLASHVSNKPWLRHKTGLLAAGLKHASVSGYHDFHEDGSEEKVFAKGSFAFAPGLVLLGNAADSETATF